MRAGPWLICSGQLGLAPPSADRTGSGGPVRSSPVLVDGGAPAQLTQALANAEGLLRDQGARLVDVVKTTVFVTDAGFFPAVNDAYTKGLTRRATVLNSAIDWPLALNSLIAITPPKASVLSFSGTALSATGTAAAGTSTGTAAGTKPGVATGTQSAAIGSIDLDVNGPVPALATSEAWINAISTSQLFANPLQGATTVEPDGSISFPFTISVTPAASLSKNASLK